MTLPWPPDATPSCACSGELLAQARRLRLNKRLGQHFLTDAAALSRIADDLAITPGEPVIEIGAGGGFLTEHLLARGAQTLAIEIDARMSALLTRRFGAHPAFTLAKGDALAFDFLAACPSSPSSESPSRVKVTGNLPYNIATPLLFRLCGDVDDADFALRGCLSQLTLMVQAEVADRLLASPGCKAYGVLGLMIAPWWETRETLALPPEAFFPPPKVRSKVVTLTPRAESLIAPAHLTTYARLTRLAFNQRRKTLRNALGGLLAPDALASMLEDLRMRRADDFAGRDPATLRPEAIPMTAYGAMAQWLDEHRGSARHDAH